MSSTAKGLEAERAVADYLYSNGYAIIDQNWKTPFAEIDVIAQKNSAIYFIEVKYRHTDNSGDGFDYITNQKLRRMQRAAEAWVTETSWDGPYELMGAAVVSNNNAFEIDIREIA